MPGAGGFDVNEMDVTIVRDFLIALLIGALVGIEREKSKAVKGDLSFGGLRTFILFAQAGSVGAWLSLHFKSPWVFVAMTAAVSAMVIAGYWKESGREREALGLTTEIAALTVFLLGAVVMFGYPELAVVLAILTSSVLAFKQPLHSAVAKLSTDDIYAGLKLLIATFIILPFLPDTAVDPWQVLVPYQLWLLVILISTLSLVGYVAVRWLGNTHGTAATGIAGGLVSSTAVTLSFARQSRVDAGPQACDALAAGILLAWTVMFVRVVLTVAIVYRALLPDVLVPFLAMALVTAAAAAIYYRRGLAAHARLERQPELPVTNPFSLTASIQFGALFAAVLLVIHFARQYAGGGGVYAVAALAGLSDVDAITLSMSQFARQEGNFAIAAGAITIAAVSNNVVKCGLVVFLGNPAMRRRVIVATAALLVAGLGSVVFV
jgi:uncharacterized membrane protein (DUF4010 family)